MAVRVAAFSSGQGTPRVEHLRDRSLALLRARWLAVALLLGAVLVRVARAEPITAPVLGVVLALPLFNLAATLVRRVGLPAPTVARLVLVQCVADAAAVALVAQSWPAPFLLALVLVPISVARDDLGWRRVVLVAAVATLVWIGTGAWLCDGPIVPVLWPPAQSCRPRCCCSGCACRNRLRARERVSGRRPRCSGRWHRAWRRRWPRVPA
ncbi:MAG: hypothetical protein U1E76_12450 [Planctomycetota bacterium]